jgi:hypothetical protein
MATFFFWRTEAGPHIPPVTQSFGSSVRNAQPLSTADLEPLAAACAQPSAPMECRGLLADHCDYFKDTGMQIYSAAYDSFRNTF